MLKINSFFLFIIALLLFYGCIKEQKNTGTNVISIDIDKKDEVSIFDIFSNVEIIQLEINDSSIIKSIDKLVVNNDNFYVFDYFESQILSYNKDGKYIFKINNKGQGPDQYIKISDFDIFNERLSLVSTMDGTIHLYDLQGNYLKKYRLPKIYGNYQFMRHLNNDTIVFWTFDYENRLKFYSKVENKIFKETMPQQNNIYSQFTTPVFPYRHYLVNAFDNRVMQMTADGDLTLAYQWDFGALNNDIYNLKEVPDLNSQEKLYDFAKKIYSSEVVNYFFGLAGGNSEYLNSQITRKNKQINIFYNKKTTNKYVFEKTVEGAAIYPIFWAENYVVGIIPTHVKNIDEILPNSILDNKNIAIKKQINEFDNPILIKYYFKK